MKEPQTEQKPRGKTADDRRKELAIDPYNDGIARSIASALKKKGVQVRSKEGMVKRSVTGMGWEVVFPQGIAGAGYSYRRKEWALESWRPTNKKEQE